MTHGIDEPLGTTAIVYEKRLWVVLFTASVQNRQSDRCSTVDIQVSIRLGMNCRSCQSVKGRLTKQA